MVGLSLLSLSEDLIVRLKCCGIFPPKVSEAVLTMFMEESHGDKGEK